MTWRGSGANEEGWGSVNATSPQRALVKVDPKYYRPTEVQQLLGNPARAKSLLGWEATTPVEIICKEMVESDLRLVRMGDLEN